MISNRRRWILGSLAVLLFSVTSCAPSKPPSISPGKKYVFAHYMLAFAKVYGTTDEAAKQEIREAQAAGIDGFVLNAGGWRKEPRYIADAERMYRAARALGTDFKLFMSADMGTITGADIRDMMLRFAGHPNQLYYQNRQVLSTFATNKKDSKWWRNQVLAPLKKRGHPVFFVPEIFLKKEIVDYSLARRAFRPWSEVANGIFYFGAAGLPQRRGPRSLISSSESFARVARENGRLFMAPVSASYWGFRQPEAGRRYFNYEGGAGIARQWASIIKTQNPQWIEIVTWNDYVESYIAPIKDANARYAHFTAGEAVEWNELGFHNTQAGILPLMSYFIKWYKTGRQPRIDQDLVFYSYRIHPKDAVAVNDPLGPVTSRYGRVRDDIYVTTLLTAPAVLRVTSGSVQYSKSLPPGIRHVRFPFKIGAQKFELIRNGIVVASNKGEDIISSPKYYNYFHTTGILKFRK